MTVDDMTSYLEALIAFLTDSAAGVAYRALVGEAQHDPAVAALLGSCDILGDSARVVLERAIGRRELPPNAAGAGAIALLVGPIFYTLLH